MGEWTEHAASLRTRFESILLSGLTNVSINGDVDNRLPHISNIAFHGTDNEGLLTMLPNIVASTGSACHYADFNPSHVLQSLGKSPDVTDCSLRFGFSNVNTMDEAAEAAHMIVKAVMEFSANA